MDGAGGGCERKSSPSVSYGAAVRGGTHTHKKKTTDRRRRQKGTGARKVRDPIAGGSGKCRLGFFRKREMGALVRRGRKNEWKLDRVMHALTQAMVFFLSRSLAHPVPCDYAQAWKVERNDPSRLPFPFVQSRRSVRPTAGI